MLREVIKKRSFYGQAFLVCLWAWIMIICIGEESFEHANVLSEKINFSALGGPGVAIFGPDDLHPMY